MNTYTGNPPAKPAARLAAENPFVWRARRPGHHHQLVCFPPAGGGAGAFADWVRLLPDGVEVCAVQLPGRQNRIHEDHPTAVGPLVRALMQALRPVLDGPFSFFGHSSGALLAYETALALQARGGPRPTHLFVSGQASPTAFMDRPKLHGLSPEEFRAEVLRLGGFDEEVTGDEDALDSLLPSVLADFSLWERHRPAAGLRLDVPISALVGDSDSRAPLHTVESWRRHTASDFDLRVFSGGHFYLFDSGAGTELLEFINSRVPAS
ncbi:thioesterase II family protein [Streptacidiphilus carbonis]|uniref:thioesterase II family protein n=1 Tax=Streptacidiphilus carbonis TaxID=105422 RepID=UPI0005AA0B77|nr:alpha/beta fold hydrolase [Streptacidiphilus carbonis]